MSEAQQSQKKNGRPSLFSPEMVELYVLRCPDTKEVRYVGKANNAQKRLASHLRDSAMRNTPVYCWIRKLLELGKAPIVECVQVVNASDWQTAEIALIAKYRQEGARLLNLADGGDQPSQTLDQRQSAGRQAANARVATPAKEELWKLKISIGVWLKWAKVNASPEDYEAACKNLRFVAQIRPDLFGKYARL